MTKIEDRLLSLINTKGRKMKPNVFLAAFALIFSTGAFGQPQTPSTSATMFGVGGKSCAAAVTPSNKLQWASWVMGFWSGLNAHASAERQTANIGESTDAQGVVAEIELYCSANPSTPLSDATFLVHGRLKMMGR